MPPLCHLKQQTRLEAVDQYTMYMTLERLKSNLLIKADKGVGCPANVTIPPQLYYLPLNYRLFKSQ